MPSAKNWNLNELTLVLIYRMGYENLILQEPVYLVDVFKMILVARKIKWGAGDRLKFYKEHSKLKQTL